MRVITARLTKRATTDGLVEFWDETPIGREYQVDLDSRRIIPMLNLESGVHHSKEMVRDVVDGGWLPTECLAFEVDS